MRIIDNPREQPPDDLQQLDLSELDCPKCGFPLAVRDIVRWPTSGTWMGGDGAARCPHCQIVFAIISERIGEEPGAWTG